MNMTELIKKIHGLSMENKVMIDIVVDGGEIGIQVMGDNFPNYSHVQKYLTVVDILNSNTPDIIEETINSCIKEVKEKLGV